jgi:DNA-binding NtrC family response regulator/pSer/pThr/pTyr-binding forkhead associated (FHA) protein
MADQDRTAPWSDDPKARVDTTFSLLVVRDGVASTYALPATGRIVIGRAPSADVRVDHGSVSREHAALHLRDATISIEDLGSANGTRVREAPLAPSSPLEVYPDDVIDLGAAILVVQYRNPAARLRRTCHFAELELRVEEECERRDERSPFAIVRFDVERGLPQHAVLVLLAATLHEGDLLAAGSDGRFDALLFNVTPEGAEERARSAVLRLEGRGAKAGVSVTCSPRDGEDVRVLLRERPASRPVPPSIPGRWVIRDAAMVRVARLLERVADSALNVLLLGETGAGKEVCADLLHAFSARRDRPLVCLNCASLSESLLDDELFGHERGAFTGAAGEKPGLLEAGSGGTVFLDEIGDIPLSTQLKLLRVLESRTVRRLGSVKVRTIDVRIVAATHQDLRERITQGQFREDLYYRLDGISVRVPPLRDRPDDIEPLARHFAAQAARTGQAVPELAPETLDWISEYEWPGNVRELKNAIGRAAALCEDGVIHVEHLRLGGVSSAASVAPRADDAASGADLRAEVKALERARIERALESCGGNQRRAAEALGISRGSLLRRLAQLGIQRARRG